MKPKGGCGSWAGRFISEEEVVAIPAYENYFRSLGVELRDQRYLVSANDFAVFCVLLRWFTQHPRKPARRRTRCRSGG